MSIICCGSLIFEGRVSELPVTEGLLINKCVEFYNDPEPCMIRRTAAQMRLYAEFEMWLDSIGAEEGRRVELCEIPAEFKGWFFDKLN